jgi:YegS/Rv2252/BmrU family lipid kinase
MHNECWFVVINPTSGNGKAKKLWPKIKQELNNQGFKYNFQFTQHDKHSIDLIQNTVNQNIKHIICIGGDGTIHNTINAIMLQKTVPSHQIHLGVIPIGTGNDWVKTHQISLNYKKAIQIIKNGALKQQDIGEIQLQNRVIFFNNLAGIGFDGYVVSKVHKYKHLGAIAYLYGTLKGLFTFKNFDVEINCNQTKIKTKALMVLVGLCQYSGGGMQLTKTPIIDDGLFDISIAHNFKAFDIVKNIIKLFNGLVTKDPKIESLKTTQISIETKDKNLPIQADGELIGYGSFSVTIHPKALSFFSA